VPFKQLDEALADDPGGAKNAYLMWSLHGSSSSILDYSGGRGTARIPEVTGVGGWGLAQERRKLGINRGAR
jgi:hypothetical protein